MGCDMSLVILMYHALEGDGSVAYHNAGESLYVLDKSLFYHQMKYLYESGIKSFSFEEIFSLQKLPRRGVIITFDDGHVSNFTLAMPILLKYGLHAEFFITTGWINTQNYLDSEQVTLLHRKGFSIGAHGKTHSFMDDLSDLEVEQELYCSKLTLEKIIEKPVISFSIPGGRVTRKPNFINIAKDVGYKIVCTSKPGIVSSLYQPYSLPRIPIKRCLKFRDFTRIVNGELQIIHRMRINYHFLSYAKKTIGNKNYAMLHNLLSMGVRKKTL